MIAGSCAAWGCFFRPCTTAIAAFVKGNGCGIEGKTLKHGVDHVGEIGWTGELYPSVGARSRRIGEADDFEGAWFSERIGGHYLRHVEGGDDAVVGQTKDVGHLFVAASVYIGEGGSAIGGAIQSIALGAHEEGLRIVFRVFDIPNFLEACGFCGAGDLVEGEATIGGFENAFAIYIGAIGSTFSGAVIDFIVVEGV